MSIGWHNLLGSDTEMPFATFVTLWNQPVQEQSQTAGNPLWEIVDWMSLCVDPAGLSLCYYEDFRLKQLVGNEFIRFSLPSSSIQN